MPYTSNLSIRLISEKHVISYKGAFWIELMICLVYELFSFIALKHRYFIVTFLIGNHHSMLFIVYIL